MHSHYEFPSKGISLLHLSRTNVVSRIFYTNAVIEILNVTRNNRESDAKSVVE